MGKRSIPVTVVGVIMALLGFVMTVALLILLAGPLMKHVSFEEFLASLKVKEDDCLGLFLSNTGLYWINLVYSASLWSAGIGIAFMKDWGRQVLMALGVIELVWMLGDFAFAHKEPKLHHAIEALIIVGLVVYMSLPSTRDKFHTAGGQ